ncbi:MULTISPECIES: hypothetical protein [unclassified Flagellimonas]|nr:MULTISPECIES: hypothetical protein [unclassified Flagellimonas]
MKTRTHYRTPVFFGWYTANSGNRKNQNNFTKKHKFSEKDTGSLK